MDAKKIVEALLEDETPLTLDFEVQVVGFPLEEYEMFGRGDGPSVDDIKAKQKTIWRLINMGVRKTGVQISNLETNYHDTTGGEYQANVTGKVSGTEDQLRGFASFGAGSDPDDRLWYVTRNDGHSFI
jgi:hypothetical protein